MPGAIDVADFSRQMDRLGERYRTMNFRKPLSICQVLIASSTKENFDRGTSPTGQAWAPLKRRRKRPKSAKRGKDKPLRDKGILMASVTGQGAGSIRKLSDNELLYGTNVFYASFHQGGTRFIPARPFLGFNDKLVSNIETVFADYAQEQIGNG